MCVLTQCTGNSGVDAWPWGGSMENGPWKGSLGFHCGTAAPALCKEGMRSEIEFENTGDLWIGSILLPAPGGTQRSNLQCH